MLFKSLNGKYQIGIKMKEYVSKSKLLSSILCISFLMPASVHAISMTGCCLQKRSWKYAEAIKDRLLNKVTPAPKAINTVLKVDGRLNTKASITCLQQKDAVIQL